MAAICTFEGSHPARLTLGGQVEQADVAPLLQ